MPPAVPQPADTEAANRSAPARTDARNRCEGGISGAREWNLAPRGAMRIYAEEIARASTKKGHRRRWPISQSRARWKRAFELPLLGSNQDSSDPESDVLPVTPRGSESFSLARSTRS